MKNMTLEKIASAVGGKLFAPEGFVDREAAGLVIDNRQVETDYIFVPIRGAKVDGHTFIADAFKKGALGVFSDHVLDEADGPYILVKNTEQALKDAAAYYRQQLDAVIIGIIGSVGKTSTKEMVASVLEQHFSVLKTQGNFNNEIGLPLTLCRIRPEHQVAVVEMGISDFGEMDRLGTMAKPDMVVMTNIGQCHLENLIDRDGVLRAKTEVFSHMKEGGRLILNGDDDKLRIADTKGLQAYYFGEDASLCQYSGSLLDSRVDGVRISLKTPNWQEEVDIPIPGEHNLHNGLAAAAAGDLLGMTKDEILAGLKGAKTIAGRNNFIEANGYTVIDDCYNANPVSMAASISVLSHAKGRKVAILGDMGELGADEKILHYNVGKEILKNDIDLLLTAGPLSKEMVRCVQEEGAGSATRAIAYEDKEALEADLFSQIKKGDTILVKASHFMNYPTIVKEITK